MIAEKHKLSYSFLRPQEARLAVCSCHCIALTDVPDVVKLDTNFQASLRLIYTVKWAVCMPFLCPSDFDPRSSIGVRLLSFDVPVCHYSCV